MNTDICYCGGKDLKECSSCRRNIKLYPNPDALIYLWFMEPDIIEDDNCIDYLNFLDKKNKKVL